MTQDNIQNQVREILAKHGHANLSEDEIKRIFEPKLLMRQDFLENILQTLTETASTLLAVKEQFDQLPRESIQLVVTTMGTVTYLSMLMLAIELEQELDRPVAKVIENYAVVHSSHQDMQQVVQSLESLRELQLKLIDALERRATKGSNQE